jgi:hypothetical protein
VKGRMVKDAQEVDHNLQWVHQALLYLQDKIIQITDINSLVHQNMKTRSKWLKIIFILVRKNMVQESEFQMISKLSIVN